MPASSMDGQWSVFRGDVQGQTPKRGEWASGRRISRHLGYTSGISRDGAASMALFGHEWRKTARGMMRMMEHCDESRLSARYSTAGQQRTMHYPHTTSFRLAAMPRCTTPVSDLHTWHAHALGRLYASPRQDRAVGKQ